MATTLPIDMAGRRFEVGHHVIEDFGGDDFDGITLVLELRSGLEASAVLTALLEAAEAARPSPD